MTEADVETTADSAVSVPLYRHLKRAEWGLAILVWEEVSRRAYQFQDGGLRVIKDRFYGLLCAVKQLPEDATELVAELRQAAGLTEERQQQRARAKKGGLSFADQVRVFRIEYPAGFGDDKWLSTIRGSGLRQRAMRHRQPAIDDAHSVLSEENLAHAVAAGSSGEIVEAITTLLGRTNLVRPKEVDVLKRLPPERHDAYVRTLRDLVFSEPARPHRFEQLAAALGRDGGWPLLTAPPALAQPQSWVCVHPAVFRRQASVLEPSLTVPARPDGRAYHRLLVLVSRVRDLLANASTPPADLMDVFDFMSVTLRPSARKLLSG